MDGLGKSCSDVLWYYYSIHDMEQIPKWKFEESQRVPRLAYHLTVIRIDRTFHSRGIGHSIPRLPTEMEVLWLLRHHRTSLSERLCT